jgi:glucokinase
MILAGDIGGTHTRLALFERGKLVGEIAKFNSPEFSGLEDIVRKFLQGKKIDKACFGIAGPIKNQVCKTTNLPWVVDAAKIKSMLQIPYVHLLNDLEANAYGLRVLESDELVEIQSGSLEKANQALISAGTGLGEAGLVWDGKKHHVCACEGGHTDFGPRTPLEVELYEYLAKKFGHVSYERVASGPGMVSIYEFLVETGREKGGAKLDPLAVAAASPKTVELFFSVYGAEAGNLALKYLAMGGVYIGGGIAAHMVKELIGSPFIKAFSDKGRFKDLLKSIPIWIVLNENAALLGAANYAETE